MCRNSERLRRISPVAPTAAQGSSLLGNAAFQIPGIPARLFEHCIEEAQSRLLDSLMRAILSAGVAAARHARRAVARLAQGAHATALVVFSGISK
jgi:hypothetical protein